MRIKAVVLLLVAGAIAVAGAGWKWSGVKKAHSNYQIAGWSWGEGRAMMDETSD